MSVARAVRRVRPRSSATAGVPLQRRLSSTESHHHDEHHESSAEYPKEGFTGPFWRNTTILAIIGFGAINFAPEGILKGAGTSGTEDPPWLTRVLAHYAPSLKTWERLNAKHLELTEEQANYNLFVQDAKRPVMHRFRYPQQFEQGSTHCMPVGGGADLNGLVVKNE
ncbi:hypothetical protein BD410DRAFT_767386 [Rickenella mellea]|uniref:Uncharacterized protein n=1 Tax=Rickenella mellea TaxID=50990 RepID=A0A4Y7QAV0_9AGAM|nr:hypothetical protein BD410DRAFT_767386 [Rickenella mellea]